ncbi:hypothetical protein ACFFV8_07685 [Sphingobium indicum]|uniref:hypothetical protein n=1 Tax=Sphingobium indicum TaxID=332055 RepID=UPI0035E4CC00
MTINPTVILRDHPADAIATMPMSHARTSMAYVRGLDPSANKPVCAAATSSKAGAITMAIAAFNERTMPHSRTMTGVRATSGYRRQQTSH